MDFTFNQDQEELRRAVRDFLGRESPMTYVRDMADDERGFLDDMWTKYTAAIESKFALDPDLSAGDITVETSNGRVTLAGRVSSPEDVAKAMRLALEQDSVLEVVSTLQIRFPRAVADRG